MAPTLPAIEDIESRRRKARLRIRTSRLRSSMTALPTVVRRMRRPSPVATYEFPATCCNYLINEFAPLGCRDFGMFFQGPKSPVPFVQHPPENALQPCDSAVFSLCVQVSWLRLNTRRRGASPGRPVRVTESSRSDEKERAGWFRGELKGTFQDASASDERNPPTTNKLGGHDEDGEKPSPRFRSGSRCDRGGTGCRSSR